MKPPKYKRILLKLSGKALSGSAPFGIAPDALKYMATEVSQVVAMGIEVGLVIGGGNLFRGATLRTTGIRQVTGDQMGMLATVMNALALRDALIQSGVDVHILSAIAMPGVVEPHSRDVALRHLAAGSVVIFTAGTGNPLFTTDSAACLRGIEIEADLILKGTRVDGIYTDDPEQVPDAHFIPHLSYQQVLVDQLGVMDLTALCLCQDHAMPIRVFNMGIAGILTEIMMGAEHGTLVSAALSE